MGDIVYGRNAVYEVIKGEMRQVKEVLIARGTKGRIIEQIIQITKGRNIVVQYVNRHKLNELAPNQNHQGVVARVGKKEYISLLDFLNSLEKKNPFLCLLDQICDPHNVGAIIRSAYLCGVDGIIIPEKRACGVNSTVVKSSSGTTEYIPIVQVKNLVYTIEKLKQKNIWIVGADISGEVCYKKDLNLPLALVIGSEGKGLRRVVKEACDFLVEIPTKRKEISLNASCAAAILMYEIMRQKKVV